MTKLLIFLAILASTLVSASANAQVFDPKSGASVSLGLSGLLGAREDARGGFVPTWASGVDGSVVVSPILAVGIRRLGVSFAQSAGGERFAIGGSPMLEVRFPLLSAFTVYSQVGVALQARFGSEQGNRAGIAPFLSAGVRFFPTDWFSVAVESVMHITASEGFLLGHEVIPQGGLILQGGLAFAVHIS